MNKIILFLFIVILFLPVHNASANILINEVMYDLDGSDTGREWIEIYNSGTSSVDISTYKLFEANTNHALTLSQGDKNLGAQSYAVIVSDKNKFKIDWPNYSGIILDSSFSLSNDGETLAIKDADLNISDQYTYDSTAGGIGDGKSLQKISNSWTALLPTPGAINQSNSNSDTSFTNNNTTTQTNSENNSTTSTTASNGSSVSSKSTYKIRVEISSTTLAVAHLPIELQGYFYDLDGIQSRSGRFFWNFGDGDSKEENVQYSNKFSHTFFYPGEYVVTLEHYPNFFGDVPDASTKLVINVVKAGVVISAVGTSEDFFIELSNTADFDTDISRWILVSGDKKFILPKNTKLESNSTLRLAPQITGFSYADRNQLQLRNSVDESVYDFSEIKFQNTKQGIKVIPEMKSTQPQSKIEDIIQNPIKISPTSDDSRLSANVLETEAENSQIKNNFLIYLSFALLVILGVLSVYFVRKKKLSDDPSAEFTIVEE